MNENDLKDKEIAFKLITNMINKQNWTKDTLIYKNQILEMYEKEIIHIINMNNKTKSLKPFSKRFMERKIDSNTFNYKNPEELATLALKEIDRIFKKII